MASKKKESLLWQFSKAETSRTHYILGTMHVSSDDAYTPVSIAKNYMELCYNYAGEMDLNDPNLSKIGEYFVNPEGLDLVDVVGEKRYNKYKKVIKKAYQIDLDSISHYKPLVIANMISESIITKSYDMALDHFLWEYAQALGMDMKGLESAEDQFSIMQSIPMESQLKGLASCVKNVKTFRKKILKMSELYAKGELTQLYKSAKKSMGELRKLMIYDRNEIMTKQLIEICDTGATFAAVGAAHLGGKKGMLRHLKHAGYKVHPVMIK